MESARFPRSNKRAVPAGRGFTLIEALIGMALVALIVLGGLDFIGASQKLFVKLRDGQEAAEQAAAAGVRIRGDAAEAGKGLAEPMAWNIILGIEPTAAGMVFRSGELRLPLAGGLLAGTEAVDVPDPNAFSPGRKVVLHDQEGGEVHAIRAAGPAARILLDAPVSRNYRPGETALILIRETELRWVGAERVVRRKINASPAQPLLEDVARFECGYAAEDNLFKARFRLIRGPEVVYEIAEFPKNLSFARRPAGS